MTRFYRLSQVPALGCAQVAVSRASVPRMSRPAWMANRVMPSADPGIPAMTAAEEKAWCRLWGITYKPRRPFKPFSNAPHPESAFPHLPSLPAKIRNLPGQMAAFR